MRKRRHNKGQAVLEYLLLTVMLSITVAVAIKNSNVNIYRFWTGLVLQVSIPCYNCQAPDPPDF